MPRPLHARRGACVLRTTVPPNCARGRPPATTRVSVGFHTRLRTGSRDGPATPTGKGFQLLAERHGPEGEDLDTEEQLRVGLPIPAVARDLVGREPARNGAEQLEAVGLDACNRFADSGRLLVAVDHEAHRVRPRARPSPDHPLPACVDRIALPPAG